jgi:hypothetical protein
LKEESDLIAKKLDIMARKIDLLTMVIACKPNGEQINKLFKNKSQKEQIRILREWNLPNEIAAFIIGTTPETVRVTLAKMKTEEKKGKTKSKAEVEE